MKALNRDLLVLSKKATNNKYELELEIEKLQQILYVAESMENFCKASEIIDLNNYKVITNPAKVEKILLQKKNKPFQFLNNKN